MKALNEYISESLSRKDEVAMERLGFKQYDEGKETWFELKTKGKLIRIVQEEAGDSSWWNAKIESEFLSNADGRPMAFETPIEAAQEVLDSLK